MKQNLKIKDLEVHSTLPLAIETSRVISLHFVFCCSINNALYNVFISTDILWLYDWKKKVVCLGVGLCNVILYVRWYLYFFLMNCISMLQPYFTIVKVAPDLTTSVSWSVYKKKWCFVSCVKYDNSSQQADLNRRVKSGHISSLNLG